MPRVSIGLPVYNGERYLDAALESLLAQTFSDFELIVSDNGSTDATGEICRRYASLDRRIRYHAEERNLGAAWNYNRVFRLASGKYFRWAAHDDLVGPELLRRCVDVLDREPTVVLCYPKTAVIDGDGNVMGLFEDGLDLGEETPHGRLRQLVRRINLANAIFGLARRETLARTGLIGPYIASDIVLLMEIALYGKFRELPEHLFFRRDHEGNVRKQSRKDIAAWFDTSGRKRTTNIQVNILLELNRAIRRAPFGPIEKAFCHAQSVRWLIRKWRTIGGKYKARAKDRVLGLRRNPDGSVSGEAAHPDREGSRPEWKTAAGRKDQ